ncbi:MAG: fatty acid cis/trans isomerase, partial [Pseudomonadota bacterium]
MYRVLDQLKRSAHRTLAAALVLLATPLSTDADEFLSRTYPQRVKEVIEQRCVVCHGCYDAPCQLKLDAWAGLARGASKDRVYDGSRLRSAALTRLYEDAHSLDAWRDRGFYSVLDADNAEQGTLYRMLALKDAYPAARGGILPDDFDFNLDRDESCPRQDEMAAYRGERPQQGMPYGLPGLDAERRRVLQEWIEDGAPGVLAPPRPATEER